MFLLFFLFVCIIITMWGDNVTNVSNVLFEKYQVRKTKQQKNEFIKFLKNNFPEMKVEEGGIPKSRNLVFGDLDNAKIVFTAHYDTCAVLPFPNFIMPKNILLTILYSVLICIPFFLMTGVVFSVLEYYLCNFLISYYVSVIFLFALILLVFILGIPNKHTANDNTSGVITVLEIMQTLTDEQREKCAFVLFDNEENGLLGSAYFRKVHKKIAKEKLIVNFDCVGDGDNIMLVYSKKSKKRYSDSLKAVFSVISDKTILHENASTTFYPSDQMGFPNNVAVAALNRKSFVGYYMSRIHTKNDTICDMRNITTLVEGFKKFTERI